MFQYYQPTKLHFGEGKLQVLKDVCKPYGNTCLLVTTPDAPLLPLYDRVKQLLEEAQIEVIHFDQVAPNPTVEIVERGFACCKENPVDFVLALGGGSSIDTAKVIAFTYGKKHIEWDDLFAFNEPFHAYASYSETHLPLISVPTTSGTGSQVTQASVITRGKEKITFFHDDNFSKESIIDPELMITLPKRMSAATGFDAFTHAFESYINDRSAHFSIMDSMEAMRLVIENLPKVLNDLRNITYRSNMCLADTLAGKALANSGASAPHPLSEIIGGIAHMTHGEALAVVFPPYIKHMDYKYHDKFMEVAKLFGSNDLYKAMISFLKSIGLYKTLKDFQVTPEQFEEIMACPVLDHLPFATKTELSAILQDAYDN